MATDALRERAGYSTTAPLQEAIARLAIFTSSAVRDPSILSDLTREIQDLPADRNVAAWKYIAFQRVNSFRYFEKSIGTGIPFERWLGGKVIFFVDHQQYSVKLIMSSKINVTQVIFHVLSVKIRLTEY
jgi:hypothetical protein